VGAGDLPAGGFGVAPEIGGQQDGLLEVL